MPYRALKGKKRSAPNLVRYAFDAYVGGKGVRKTVLCRKSAVDVVFAQWINSLHATAAFVPVSLFETFERYLEEHSRVHKSSRQYKAEQSFYRNRFTKFFCDTADLGDIRRKVIEDYLTWRYQESGKAPSRSTINKEINIMSSFFSWCIRHELYRKGNPCQGVRLREDNDRHIQLTPGQILEIVEKAKDHGNLHTAVMLALFAGLRKNEVSKLRWEDVDLGTRRLNLRSETTKTKRFRAIPIPDILYDHLVSLPMEIGEPVVGLGYDGIRYNFCRLRETLSFKNTLPVKQLTFHDLRHCYAQVLRDAGVPLGDIQAFLGHSSVVVTEKRYAQAGGYAGLEKVNRINTLLQNGDHVH